MSQSGINNTSVVPVTVTETLTGNSGGVVSPTGNNINTVGSGSITIVGNPATSTLTTELTGLTNNTVLLGQGTTTIGTLALTNGQLVVGSTAATPVAATLTAGTGVSVVNGAGSITINSTGAGLTYTTVTTATQAAAINNGYIANYTGTLIITLPATSPVGSVISVTGINNNTGWQIAQNASNQIFLANMSSTSGTVGYLASTNTRDTVTLLCVTANAQWNVVSSMGNITVA